jgi:hypothetical protein
MERRTNIFFSFHRQTVGTGQETVVRALFVIFRGEEKSAQKKNIPTLAMAICCLSLVPVSVSKHMLSASDSLHTLMNESGRQKKTGAKLVLVAKMINSYRTRPGRGGGSSLIIISLFEGETLVSINRDEATDAMYPSTNFHFRCFALLIEKRFRRHKHRARGCMIYEFGSTRTENFSAGPIKT